MPTDLPKYSFHNTSGTSGLEIQHLEYFTAYCNPVKVETHHRVDFYLILFVTKGHGQFSVDFETYSYEPGTLFFVAKNQVTAFSLNPEAEGFLIYLTEAFYQQHQVQFNELLFSYPFNPGLYGPVLYLKSEIEAFASLFNCIDNDYMRHQSSYHKGIPARFFN